MIDTPEAGAGEREAFEKWAQEEPSRSGGPNLPLHFDKWGEEEYDDRGTYCAWRAWQARAALAPTSEPSAGGLKEGVSVEPLTWKWDLEPTSFELKARIEALEAEFGKVADFIERHWRGAGLKLEAEWMLKELVRWTDNNAELEDNAEALEAENAKLKQERDSERREREACHEVWADFRRRLEGAIPDVQHWPMFQCADRIVERVAKAEAEAASLRSGLAVKPLEWTQAGRDSWIAFSASGVLDIERYAWLEVPFKLSGRGQAGFSYWSTLKLAQDRAQAEHEGAIRSFVDEAILSCLVRPTPVAEVAAEREEQL